MANSFVDSVIKFWLTSDHTLIWKCRESFNILLTLEISIVKFTGIRTAYLICNLNSAEIWAKIYNYVMLWTFVQRKPNYFFRIVTFAKYLWRTNLKNWLIFQAEFSKYLSVVTYLKK